MDLVRTRDLVRKGITASTAKQAFEDNLDLDGSTRGGGKEYKKKHPRTGHPQPASYSYDQPSTAQPQAGQYPTQGQGYYAPPSNNGPSSNGYGQAASGAPQYPPYPPTPQQSPPPIYCTCMICKHCTVYYTPTYNAHSQVVYYCRIHRGQLMAWVEPGTTNHDGACLANQQTHNGYHQQTSASGPSYGQGYGQPSGSTTRGLYSDGSPPPGGQSYQGSPQSNYTYGGSWTQEPAQLPDQGSPGEASSYYNSNAYPRYPR
ncbi:hypothetical protein PRZ48_015191 [Zasmidium cellare]|uniref:Uncharacterized protein n=1 Tax=Zasmidium cellare TaxID=395010 RepID=A0ABR0DYC8_ZASCE|nr:hypothetical protein PRZ48_015191 [Zasmidium cellare]